MVPDNEQKLNLDEKKNLPTVFICYSRKNKQWVRDWLLPKLENADLQVHIDFRDFEIGLPSILNMERAVEKCSKTLLVMTPYWINSEFSQFEAIMLQTGDPIGLKKRVLPLMLEDCSLPPRLKIFTYADFRQKSNWDFQIQRLIKQVKKDFAALEQPPREFPPLPDENIDIIRLPKTPYELFGRQKELKMLNQAWESPNTNVLAFVAYGGVGKSTLVNKWLEKMRWDNYRGASRVFGCSFYSQGTKERVTSADKFISEALTWFGDPDPTQGSPWDKGQRLADLVRKQKTLLILDGLEPLQSPSDFERGRIKDPALSLFVTQLARSNNGLCVITTRESVPELTPFDKSTSQPKLDQISKEAGASLLRIGGVLGTEAQLRKASVQFGNHALAVNLLATYLHDIPGHHIKNASNIPDLDIPEEQGKHPRRVIEAFEKRFGKSPQLQLLQILGLFDRPAELSAIQAVYAPPPIPGLTDQLQNLSGSQWNELFEQLRNLKLLARKSTHTPDIVDCHPIIREHFAEKLQSANPKGWKKAHSRLYEYYKNLPEKEFPDTLEEMQPLFAAVTHGCLAGRYQQSFYDIYWNRIQRGDEYYSTMQLGAYGADLAALSAFFEIPWTKPASALTDTDKAIVLNLAGFRLRALGRLKEATQPMEAGMELLINQEHWKNATRAANNLSELYLTLGRFQKSIDYARKSIDYADKSGEEFGRYAFHTTLADALHYSGQLQKAKELFEQAENVQKDHTSQFLYLYSLWGFHFCDLLLTQGKYKQLRERAIHTITIAQRNNWVLDIALDTLSLGRAYLLQTLLEKTGDFNKAVDFLNQAVDGLRKAGTQDHLPRGLFARAELHRYQRIFDKAWTDLNEACEIAERGQMKLFLADYHLEAARLSFAEGKVKQARDNYNKAQTLVNDMAYHLRDPELLLIKAGLEIADSNKGSAAKTLAQAEECINKMTAHRWDLDLSHLQQKLT